MTFLHLACIESVRDVIVATLGRLNRDETVLSGRDGLAEGPLHDVDAGGGLSRIEWWSRVHGKPLDTSEAQDLDDRDLWAQVRKSELAVMLWHGPCPMERIFALRACWHLRRLAWLLAEERNDATSPRYPPRWIHDVLIKNGAAMIRWFSPEEWTAGHAGYDQIDD